MIDDDEQTWKEQVEARAVDDFSKLWGRCAAAGFTAVLIAPVAMLLVFAIAEGLRRGHSPIGVGPGQFLTGFVTFYGLTLLFSLPASIPCAIVYAIAAYKLRVRGILNWMTSAAIGAALGILASILVNVTVFAGKAPHILALGELVLIAPVGAVTTLVAYLLCLRRATAP